MPTYSEDKYEELAEGDMDLATKTAIDHEPKLTVESGGEREVRVRKTLDDFEILLVNEFIDLEAGRRQSLASKALADDERVPVHHVLFDREFDAGEPRVGGFPKHTHPPHVCSRRNSS